MFYVSQPNVLMIKLVSVVFFVTVTVALGGVLLIIKWTYDYPLIRLAASVALFFLRPLSDCGCWASWDWPFSWWRWRDLRSDLPVDDQPERDPGAAAALAVGGD
ncbi:tripartite multidrug resistance system membrane fusion protein [Klebsiella pneumoniae]|uniref:Tripartite multidrug resistance system membrane fusion protein n=1 Tax=Klebsiella pneumoniae TaxID=573 RepID=A0A378BS62_KLEPN|nr:tripartite multidrug resistance system membrane fusion protein [Klebsiella pneumoniae]